MAECIYLYIDSANYSEAAMLFSGREKEKELLEKCMKSTESEMIAIIGRRRVGKTRLVRESFKGMIDFEMTGIYEATLSEQLENFKSKLSEYGGKPVDVTPKSWFEAFSLLKDFLSGKRVKRKKVIFFDELPWIASARSKFLQNFSHFWNDWAEKNGVVIIICGSAASWMVTNVVHHKGGLHNRITRFIQLKPFTLSETSAYFKKQKISLTQYQITQLYMIMGGVPHYLKEVERGQSVSQIIDKLCFSDYGLLKDEYSKLLASLYKQSDIHDAILRSLGKKWQGLTRQDIVKISGLNDGGSINRALKELEESSFISQYQPFGKKKKGTLFRLTDYYILFYLKFMEGKKISGEGAFSQLYSKPTWSSWSGYAFENLCLNHSGQIKQALGIPSVYTVSSSFIAKGDKQKNGAQIDMLLDRDDGVINICEAKFYDGRFTITKEYAAKLRNKRIVLKEHTGTLKNLSLVIISPFGLNQNEYSLDLIDNSITLEDLFKG